MLTERQTIEETQSVLHEFLALLTEVEELQTPHYLSVLESLLHLLTDLETYLALSRVRSEHERLIYNDLLVCTPTLVEDDP